MSPTEFAITPDQVARLHALSVRTGKPESQVLDDLLDSVVSPTPAATGAENGATARTALEAFEQAGVVGCLDGPGDLATNPKYMEGFGQDD